MSNFQTPPFLSEHPREVINQRCNIPMWCGIGPVWSYNENAGGFYALIALEAEGDPAWDCEHRHPTRDEAWACLRKKLIEISES